VVFTSGAFLVVEPLYARVKTYYAQDRASIMREPGNKPVTHPETAKHQGDGVG
jgi:hypothetical protein